MSGLRRWLALAVAMVLVLAACGGGDDDAQTSGGTSETTAGADGPRTASFRGVTADTIKLGVVHVDYEAIKQFVDFNRGDQQKVMQILIDDMNANGGVGGRKLEPVYKQYSPIGNAKALEVCTSLTEDEKVFAVVGLMVDFSGDAQLCLARDHETIHIGSELRKQWIEDAPPAMLMTPFITADRRADVLMNLLKQEDTLKGKKVASLGDQDTQTTIDGTIKPGLKDMGAEQGSTAILTIAKPQDPGALAQLDSFLERWKQERVEAVVLSGFRVSAKVYVEKIKSVMPSLQLLSDQPSGVVEAGQDAVANKQNPNPYEGILSAEGLSAQERFENKTPILQKCVETYEKVSGEKIVAPEEVKPGPDGKRTEMFITVSGACGFLHMFKTIAEKAGPNLTNESWTKAVDNFGPIELVSTEIASLKKGKYDADDAFRLVTFDSKASGKGGWRPVTELTDATKS